MTVAEAIAVLEQMAENVDVVTLEFSIDGFLFSYDEEREELVPDGANEDVIDADEIELDEEAELWKKGRELTG
jgi:hypothetical protein